MLLGAATEALAATLPLTHKIVVDVAEKYTDPDLGGGIARLWQHGEIQIGEDGSAVLEPNEGLSLDESEAWRPHGDRVGDAAHRDRLRAEIRHRPGEQRERNDVAARGG